MQFQCIECGGNLDIPVKVEKGDIYNCPECGTDYVIEKNDKGENQIKELNLEEEDWGE